MSPRLPAGLALLLLALPASAQFEGIADVRMTSHEEGSRMEGKGRLWISAAAWRIEMEMTAAEAEKESPPAAAMNLVGQRMVVLGKTSEPGKVWMLNERMRTYAIVEDGGKAEPAPGGAWKLTRLGADRVAGLACTNVKAERAGHDGTFEACLAKEISTSQWLKGMREGDEEGWMLAAQRAGVTGHPVRMIERASDGTERTRFEVTRVERKKLGASLFEVPKGYRQTSVMESLAQTPEQQAQMEEARRQLEEAMKSMPPEQRKMMEDLMKQGAGKK